ncbi:MAG TPA: hypothetical protein VHD32_02265 [Candidatus Didemnitutus sp.]|nr:hypothetical protein [Candidatus Didemnitutus sp.]
MTVWKNSGSYLERPIQITSCGHWNCLLPVNSLMDSLVFVLMGSGQRYSKECGEYFLAMLIRATPLGITLYGQDAKVAFDSLIGLLTEAPAGKHIMTKFIEGQGTAEALKAFFQATWPSEERFDEWKRYSVILLAEENRVPELTRVIEHICE